MMYLKIPHALFIHLRELILDTLRKLGYHAVVADTPDDACRLVREHCGDLA